MVIVKGSTTGGYGGLHPSGIGEEKRKADAAYVRVGREVVDLVIRGKKGARNLGGRTWEKDSRPRIRKRRKKEKLTGAELKR